MSNFVINADPAMTRFLVGQTTIFRDCPIYIVDVGSRDGFNVEWKVFGDCLHVYCFEPDETECARLNAGAGPNIRYLPAALAAQAGDAVLYEAKLNYSTSLYKTDMTYFSRLLNRDNGIIVGQHSIRVFTLDEVLRTHGVDTIDFIKLDAEGAELDILKGAPNILSSPHLAGILSEIRFQREINHSPIFSDLDAFLRPHGFHLYDLQFHHQSRRVLPYPGLQDYRLPSGEKFFAYTTHGQIMDGDALYFRDLLTPINAERRQALSAAQILKYAAFYELYSLGDCAAELLIENQSALNGTVDVGHLLELLTPPIDGKRLGYDEYRRAYFETQSVDSYRATPSQRPLFEGKANHDGQPLVSIVMFCRNGAASIQRSIHSVLNQSYPKIEFIIQDGASTDGTVEILKSYGDRIDFVSAPDDGTNDGFWRALLRCNGEIIGTCLSDEELLPDAVARVVAEFQSNAAIAAITGDAYLSDLSGNITGKFDGSEFNFLGYLLGDYCPNFSASFFRSQALLNSGMFDERWKEGKLDSVEFEIWCRLGTEQRIKYIPETFSKYGIHPGQMSHRLDRIIGELASRTLILDRYLFGTGKFFGANPELRDAIIHRQHEIIINHLDWNGKPDEAKAVGKQLANVMSASSLRALRHGDEKIVLSKGSVAALRALVPRQLRARIPLKVKLAMHDGLVRPFGAARRISRKLKAAKERVKNIVSPPPPVVEDTGPKLSDWEKQRGQFYHDIAVRFRDRGQIEPAWLAWKHAQPLNNIYIDSMALQAKIKSPESTDAQLLELQHEWAAKFATPLPGKPPATFKRKAPGQKPVIGYHCGFWHVNTGRSQALPLIAAHDRSNFKIIGYAPSEEAEDVRRHFDEFHVTGHLSNGDFVDLVRSHQVDVFVEMTGLSFPHRLAAAAVRCAPVQATYLNHTGTVGIENIDYVIGDEIATPVVCDPHYSETIYRLPRCFFSFSYNEDELPAVAPPPMIANGYVTYGCFGGGDKLNSEILKVWADLLRHSEKSRLILQNPSMSSIANQEFIRKQFQWLGVDTSRITLLPGADRSTILRNYSMVDISLDTFPYCGGNTIAESVWQGVPVVSYKGDRFSSAYGASLFHACGLADLVADNFDAYVRLADQLGHDKERLLFLRQNLRRLARENGLGDPQGLARSLEAAYVDMLRQKA